MNKTELIAEVAKKCGMSKKDAEKAVSATFDTITEVLCAGDKVQLVGFGAFRTNSVAGVDGIVDKPMTIDADGPSGFTSFISEADVYGTCLYQAEAVMGATWNVELARQMGEVVGDEGNVGNEKTGVPYSGWYAPAVNIRRSPFAGRNWEYYSEDGLLSGKLPGLDAVSFGPDLLDIHTPRERMNIPSVARTWQYLTAVLKALKA